jgi:hypothetical protein
LAKSKKGSGPSSLLLELQRRAEVKTFTISDYCFAEQLRFISDPARFKTAVCSRRSGKSHACAGDMINVANTGPHHNVAYITLSRTSAKRIIWPVLIEIINKFKIKCAINNTELTITFEGGSTIYLMGAKDAGEIEKLRGLSLKRVYIDEAQSIKESILEVLIDDILAYATMDVNGTICLIGTPGPIAAGYFYNASHSGKWSNHKWTIHNNIWIKIKSGKEPATLLAEERARKGIDETNPTYRREALAEWVTDYDALVFKFNANKNVHDGLPPGRYNYIFGIDIGFHDADAIAVIAYNYTDRNFYLVEEDVRRKQDITDLANRIKMLQAKYSPIKMVIDTGGLGKKTAEELQRRHSLPLEAADKIRKFENIELLNDELRNGHFKVPRNSLFEDDCYKLEWDRDNPERLKVSDRFHSDITDAVLYAAKEAFAYLAAAEPKKPARNSNEYEAEIERQLSEKLQQETEAKERGEYSQEELDFIIGDKE